MRAAARRRFLAVLAGAAAVPLFPASRALAQAEAEVLRPVIARLTAGAPLREGRVRVDTPRLADNGHSVPLKVSVDSPMNATEHVRSITLLSERNPRPLMATFYLGPRAGRAEVTTRVRLNGTQRVLAVAQLSDGTFWSGSTEVEVTESACLDAT